MELGEVEGGRWKGVVVFVWWRSTLIKVTSVVMQGVKERE